MFNRILRALALAVPLLAAQPAQAQTQATLDEGIVLGIPVGWYEAFHGIRNGVFTAEHLPLGEGRKNWTRMIVVQTYRELPAGAALFLDRFAKEANTACERLAIGPLVTASADGYEAAMRETSCGKARDGGHGEYILSKAIKGKSSFFVVQWAARLPAYDPFAGIPIAAGELERWMTFMQASRICRMDDSDRACVRSGEAPAEPEKK